MSNRATRLQRHPVRRVQAVPDLYRDPAEWPFRIPAVAQLLRDGLDLGPITVLVGGNGQGKSTIVEALAMAFGMNAEGGSRNAMHQTRPSESPLHEHLEFVRNAGAGPAGFFLRAETMHGLFSYLEDVTPERFTSDLTASPSSICWSAEGSSATGSSSSTSRNRRCPSTGSWCCSAPSSIWSTIVQAR